LDEANASEDEMKKKFEQEQEEEQKKAAEQLYGEVVDEAQKKNIEDQISINMDKKYQYVQISLNGAILFDSGSAEIKKSMTSLLSKVGDILKLYDKNTIKIEGHTDNVPISGGQYKNNMWLSTARATQVFEYLVNKKKMDPSTLEPTGRGEYNPVASNKTAKGRARNRRVELKIYTEK
jgi:chemotaxis protein MotB